MARLAVFLLGLFQIILDGEPITHFPTDKERALLAYLVTEADRPHRREALASLLWGGVPEDTAHNNLRRTLHRLRRTLGDDDTATPFLLVAPRTVQFNLASDHTVDLNEFLAGLNRIDTHLHRRAETCEICRGWRETAASRYRGDFLQGFALPDSIEFDEWLAIKREKFRLRGLDIFDQLAEQYIQRGDYEHARHYALRQIEIEPWREAAHRQLMTAFARSGQRAAALAQYESCCRVLAEELGVEPESVTIALYETIKQGNLAESAPNPAYTLPARSTLFIGREAELARLSGRLLDPAQRLLTIVGEGGLGKTRLALAAAEDVKWDFAQGVWFVQLAGLTKNEWQAAGDGHAQLQNGLATAIADALNFTFFSRGEPKAQLLNYLRQKELLLILDNFEHLLAGADLILEILAAAPKVVVLVTSREPLDFQAEYLIRLEGLPVPETAGDPEAKTSSSVRLFVERAQRTAQHFQLDASTLPSVVQVCKFLNGLPLGIELAATWVRRRTPAEIVQALHDIDFLATTHSDVALRHRSLRAVFEGSWALLSPRHQVRLAQASVFRGGFDERAAKVILEADPADLWALTDKSLLRRAATGRYEMHELLRQFAAEKLESSLKPVVSNRHSTFYLEFVAQRDAAFRGSRPQTAMTEIRGEIENVRTAWNWAVVEGRLAELAQSVNGLAAFYEFSSLYQEGINVFELTIERLTVQLESEQPASSADEIVAILARLWVHLARCFFNRARYEQAGAAAQKAIRLAGSVHALASEAMGYLRWGYALWRSGQFSTAQTQIVHGLRLARAAELPLLEADCLRGLGNVAWSQGDWAGAQHYFEQALYLYRELSDRWSEGRTLINLGMVASSQADLSHARKYYEQVLPLCPESGDPLLEFHALNELGTVARQQGNFDEAHRYIEQALQAYREAGDRYNEGRALGNLGDVARQLGDLASAQIFYEQALTLFREIGARLGESSRLAALGLLLHQMGNNAAAQQQSQAALAIARDLGARHEHGLALTCLGHAQFAQNCPAEAAEAYRQAAGIHRDLKHFNLAMEPLAGLARVALTQGEAMSALSYIEEILTHLKTGTLHGAEEPLRVYLTCYEVLQAVSDARATLILREAKSLLNLQAEKIESAPLRRSFLENGPVHRKIIQSKPA